MTDKDRTTENRPQGPADPTAPSGTIGFGIAGIPVTIHPWFWLVTIAIGSQHRDARLTAVWVAVVLFSVLVHELGHAAAGRAFGGSPRIELHGMGGTTFTSTRADAPLTTWQQIIVSLAGPFAGIACGAIAFVMRGFVAPWLENDIVRTAFGDLLWANWGYGLLNFLPILPLDGGHVMQATIEKIRGRQSSDLAGVVSLVVAVALGVLAIVYRLNSALFMLGWLAISHGRTVKDWWNGRHDAALEQELEAVGAALTRSEFVTVIERATALRTRVRSLEGQAQVLCLLADAAVRDKRVALAEEALDAFPAGWRPDANVELRVRIASGKPQLAVESLRTRLKEKRDAALVPLLAQALLAANDLSGAMDCVLQVPGEVDRGVLFHVEAALFYGGQFEDSARVATVAFERFGVPDDAYNVACALSRAGRLDEAMPWLARAIDAGYADAAHLDADEDLAAIKERDDYRVIRARLKTG